MLYLLYAVFQPEQNVVRNWYARDPEIVKTEDNLVKVAWELAAALEKGLSQDQHNL